MKTTIYEIYKHCKDNNKSMLMDNSLLSYYPTIEGNTSNFIQDYLTNYDKLDRVFALKYMSKKPMFLDEKTTFPTIYNEWLENSKDFVYYYIDTWARLYFALSKDYNPIENYNGISTTTTSGQVEGLSGKDSHTLNSGEKNATETLGSTSGESTMYNVPYDSTIEKETEKNIATTSSVTNSNHSDSYTDTNTTNYGKTNTVNYTVLETKSGNLGVRSTQEMLESSYELALKNFWDNVFSTISKELCLW